MNGEFMYGPLQREAVYSDREVPTFRRTHNMKEAL